jgi:putative tryptophan/tyrosine transport system ATP-binding protein
MLTLRDIVKTFLRGTPNQMTALDRLSIAVREGDFITVIGSNGAGKSTLLKVIGGLVEPDAGSVELDGRDITRLPVWRRAAVVGRIAQDPQESTCAVMTIAENLAMAAKRGQRRGLRRAVTPALAERFRSALAQVGLGLEERLNVRIGTLSGGQRQAVALLMATLARPRLLLLDEHLASLDPKTGEAVMQMTAKLIAAERLATIMVTHNMQEAIRWGNRLVMMHEGRIIFDVEGAAKAALTVTDLVEKFHEASRGELIDDRMLLTS